MDIVSELLNDYKSEKCILDEDGEKALKEVYTYLKYINLRTLLFNIDLLNKIAKVMEKYSSDSEYCKLKTYFINLSAVLCIANAHSSRVFDSVVDYLQSQHSLFDDLDLEGNSQANTPDSDSLELNENEKMIDNIEGFIKYKIKYKNVDSIIQYVKSGYLNREILNKEIEDILDCFKDENLTDVQKVQKVFDNIYDYTDQEIQDNVGKSLELVKNNAIPLADIPIIYMHISNLKSDGIVRLEEDDDRLFELFLDCLNNGEHSYDEKLHTKFIPIKEFKKLTEKTKELLEQAEARNNELLCEKSSSEVDNFMLDSSKWHDYNMCSEMDSRSFDHLDASKFLEEFTEEKTTNRERHIMLSYLISRLGSKRISKKEEKFYGDLDQSINRYLSEHEEIGLSRKFCERLGQIIEKRLSDIENVGN